MKSCPRGVRKRLRGHLRQVARSRCSRESPLTIVYHVLADPPRKRAFSSSRCDSAAFSGDGAPWRRVFRRWLNQPSYSRTYGSTSSLASQAERSAHPEGTRVRWCSLGCRFWVLCRGRQAPAPRPHIGSVRGDSDRRHADRPPSSQAISADLKSCCCLPSRPIGVRIGVNSVSH